MTAVITPADLVLAENVGAALKIGAGFNWKAAIVAFESGSTQEKIVDGLIAVDDVAQIVGLFFPPAAIVANDLGIAISIEPVIASLVQWLQHQPVFTATEASVWSRLKGFFKKG